MARTFLAAVSRRERQIMEIVFQLGSATASDVQNRLPDPPGYSAVRTMLTRLEDKGYLTHVQEGPRYVYSPTVDRARAGGSALERMVHTFFDGSPGKTVAALLDRSSEELSTDELDQLAEMIERLRRERER